MAKKKKAIKEYIIHDTTGDRHSQFFDTENQSLEDGIRCIIDELVEEMGISYEDACHEFSSNFLVYELSKELKVNIETVITIK